MLIFFLGHDIICNSFVLIFFPFVFLFVLCIFITPRWSQWLTGYTLTHLWLYLPWIICLAGSPLLDAKKHWVKHLFHYEQSAVDPVCDPTVVYVIPSKQYCGCYTYPYCVYARPILSIQIVICLSLLFAPRLEISQPVLLPQLCQSLPINDKTCYKWIFQQQLIENQRKFEHASFVHTALISFWHQSFISSPPPHYPTSCDSF